MHGYEALGSSYTSFRTRDCYTKRKLLLGWSVIVFQLFICVVSSCVVSLEQQFVYQWSRFGREVRS